jgi:predicted transposase YdaD
MAEEAPQGFFAWLMETLGRQGFVLQETNVSKELAPQARHIDLVWRILTPRGAEALLHIELQLDPDGTMGQRILEYGMRLYERDHFPVVSVDIWLKRVANPPAPPFIVYLDDEEWFRYPYSVIRLWEVPQERILEQPYPVLWPLAGMMAGASAESVTAVGQQIAESEKVQTTLKEELIGYLGLLAGVQLSNEEVREALRRHPMVNDLWQHSSVAQALKEEGRIEEAREMAQIALEDHFGALSADVLAALKSADEATLKKLIIVKSLEDARARLGLQ